MSERADDATRLSRCRQCGSDLAIDAAEGLCPACLMAAALAGATSARGDEATVLSDAGGAAIPGGATSRLVPGQPFGPYKIARLLGRGGMGEVYEAEHVEHGRRVALKVLNQRLAGPDDRARFLREGQLAASISHPNTVYIFGSEEIGGAPVISMELVAGGTLKDRVESAGVFLPSAAVDATLDLIAGLDAAQAGGILHRDIKPSNCFVAPDGAVKVGDFGLSISTLARDVGAGAEAGGFQGTPQYAAPEQLKGQPLDVRADIYAVGATLYYLLTGRPPFDDRDLATLVTRVTIEPPESPRVARRAIPRGLATVVLRCLAKDRAARPSSYAELEDALRQFSSAAPAPATLGLRFVAGAIDRLLLAAVTLPVTLSPVLQFTAPASVNFSVNYKGPDEEGAALAVKVGACLIAFVYYTLLEGLGGASLGKRLCGLRVTHKGRVPGVARAAVRTSVFMLPMAFMIFGPSFKVEPASDHLDAHLILLGARAAALSLTIAWIGFTSIRRRNGYAAWHDLASGTRVVLERHDESRATFPQPTEQGSSSSGTPGHRIGPYEISGTLGRANSGELLAGFDPVLRRRVWLHVLPPGTPAVAPERRDVGRPARLHWLSGQRRGHEAWDAYEAPDGAPLVVLATTGRPWRTVRHWLDDLGREIHAAERDGTLPELSVDRVWITRASRAVLLEFPAPMSGRGAAVVTTPLMPQRFLAAVATSALEQTPLPLSARDTVDALDREAIPAGNLARTLTALTRRLDRVTAWRRAVSLSLTNIPLLFVAVAFLTLLPTALRVSRLDFLLPVNCLVEINKLESSTDADAEKLRRALETYCAATYGPEYRQQGFWEDRRGLSITSALRPLAERAVAHYPSVAPADARAAAEATRATLTEDDTKSGAATGMAIAIALPSAVLLLCAALAVLSNLVVRGGILNRLLGLAIVNRRGTRVSRPHGLWRALIAWSPVALFWVHVAISNALGRKFETTFLTIWIVVLTFGTSAAGTLWTIVRPSRGWHDRIARTWLVPR